MKPSDRRHFKPHRRLEQQYANEMLDMMFERILPRFSGLSLGLMMSSVLPDAFDIQDFAYRIASRMVTGVSVANAKSWREAASISSRGRLIYSGLKTEMNGPVGIAARQMVRENARLIQSLPNDLATSVSRFIASQQLKGVRSETLQAELKTRIPQLAESRVRLIARTETAKAETAFTQARAENLGLRYFQWATSEDQRVRRSHRLMDKVLVAWNDLPAPEQLAGEKSTLGHYPAGGAQNCRCVSLPLVRLDEVAWPAKVYHSGQITRMRMADFKHLSGMEVERRAA
jgi:hypothetical protein